MHESELPQEVSTEALAASDHGTTLQVFSMDSRSTSGSMIGTMHFIPEVGVSVISDIDDTIKNTEVLKRDEMLRNTFLREFKVVKGMDKLFSSWATQGAAFHYVSSSPWQLQPELHALFQTHGLPQGSYHLRHFDIRGRKILNLFSSSTKSKPRTIEMIMDSFPRRKFVLVGDSAEKDPEIYAAIARSRPEQVLHIYIRRVDGDMRNAETLAEVFQGLPLESWTLFRNVSDLLSNPRHAEVVSECSMDMLV